MKNIKNIIFDLGAVLLNLDFSRTDAAFADLVGGQNKFQTIRQALFEKDIFDKFETNEIQEEEFIATFKAYNEHPLTDGQVRMAWSAMLLDLPRERIELLKELRIAGYQLYLLSNINSIHLYDVYEIVERTHENLDFDALFVKPYYSHLIGHRKPHSATYQYVIEDAGIEATETLFIDDNAANIEGAKSIGLQTIHHPANSDLKTSLSSLLTLD